LVSWFSSLLVHAQRYVHLAGGGLIELNGGADAV
jgi:hypothetical protein